ncbi:ABC transporter substrate-binding protein [Acetivibrio mesophilus]|uniref:ABC transporter substrate-binding protein n=1 Tax=Acetivibrio mesophilus TaxID=2487273 RepID=A0A4V1K272_9FIRM|nr:ABC transporter substrate-binding protein [Acetivibrio mesophilus]ODM26856.1 ABC transporter substrate-binding protein [Clostridium sp. Bc-iso-3]RXE59279.1 ABC transporter substrate-binding protein [Acetivibrio mesophilus]HHV28352.1 ABC transporter substrate-binding protein [Clostridium sp.]
MKRRSILTAICLIIIFAFTVTGCGIENTPSPSPDGTSSGAGKQKINFVLDWVPNTNHTGIYVAKIKGYFSEEGLDVDIIQPGESSADQLVASNTAQFGISYQEGVTFARSSGAPLVSLAAVIQHNTSGFGSFKDKGIVSPMDFEGKKYGGWGSEVEAAMVKQVVRDAGGDPDKVQILTTGTADFLQASETGQIDFAWIFEGWDYINATNKGVELNYIDLGKLSDVFDYYTPVIVTNEDNINNNPELVQKFMRAAEKGYRFAIENPDEAAECLLQLAPELDRELVIKSQQFLASKYQDDAPYWGMQKKEVWERYMNWLYENKFIDAPIDVEKAFTNDFLQTAK